MIVKSIDCRGNRANLIGNELLDVVQRKNFARRQQEAFNGALERGDCVIALASDIEGVETPTHVHQFSLSQTMARSERELMKVNDKLMNRVM